MIESNKITLKNLKRKGFNFTILSLNKKSSTIGRAFNFCVLIFLLSGFRSLTLNF
jgi:hypothetical protein